MFIYVCISELPTWLANVHLENTRRFGRGFFTSRHEKDLSLLRQSVFGDSDPIFDLQGLDALYIANNVEKLDNLFIKPPHADRGPDLLCVFRVREAVATNSPLLPMSDPMGLVIFAASHKTASGYDNVSGSNVGEVFDYTSPSFTFTRTHTHSDGSKEKVEVKGYVNDLVCRLREKNYGVAGVIRWHNCFPTGDMFFFCEN